MPSRDFCTLPHKRSNIHAVFERSTLKFAHVFYVSLQSLLRMCFCFRWKCGIPSDPNIPKKAIKPKISGELPPQKRKRKNQFVKRLGKPTLNTCKILRSIPLKNGEDIGLWSNLVFMLELACINLRDSPTIRQVMTPVRQTRSSHGSLYPLGCWL